MTHNLRKVLGIDFGTTRIGLAIARGPLAEPLEIVANDGEDRALARIKQLVESEQIEQIIMGISENRMAQRTKEFAASLKAVIDIPIEFVDETLSSYEMHHRLLSSKLSTKQGPIDHFVAAQLLQDWLDS